jgi:hypothetical protein
VRLYLRFAKVRARALALIVFLAMATPSTYSAPRQTPDFLRMPHDCLLLAMQAYARVRDVCDWSAVVIVTLKDTRRGHAVCVFEVIDGSVWVYDENGSVHLGTKSHDLKVLVPRLEKAMGEKFSAATMMRND